MRGGDFLLLTAREEADVRVKLGVGAAHQNLAVGPLLRLQHLLQSGGQCVKGLGGARRPLDDGQGRLLRRQQQGLLHKLLAYAPGLDAEWADAAKAQGGHPFLMKAAQHGLFRLGIRAQKDELILGQGNRLPLPRTVHGIELLRWRPFFLKGRKQTVWDIDLRPPGVGLGAVR